MIPIDIYIQDGSNNESLFRYVPFCPRIGETLLIAKDANSDVNEEFIVSKVTIYATVELKYTSITRVEVVPKFDTKE